MNSADADQYRVHVLRLYKRNKLPSNGERYFRKNSISGFKSPLGPTALFFKNNQNYWIGGMMEDYDDPTRICPLLLIMKRESGAYVQSQAWRMKGSLCPIKQGAQSALYSIDIIR